MSDDAVVVKRVLPLFLRGDACRHVEQSVTAISQLLGEMQILLAYLAGLPIGDEERMTALLSRIKNAKLQELLRAFQEGDHDTQSEIGAFSFLLVLLGSRGYDFHTAFAGRAEEFTGRLNQVRACIGSYEGFTNTKTGEWVEGEIAKLEAQQRDLQAKLAL